MKKNLFNSTVKILKWQIRITDIAFVLIFAAVSVFFFLNAPIGITECDESIYLFPCFRLYLGDKLIADDWTFTNLSSVFLYLPFRIFYAILGGAEGLILAMRYLYVCIKLILFFYIYFRLREYGWWAMLAGASYVGTDFFGVKTISYYSICANAVLISSMILFVRNEKKTRHYIFAGFLFSCAVIAEPFAAIVWIIYSIVVLAAELRKKMNKPVLQEYSFILSGQVWLRITGGVCIAAALFIVLCAVFFTGSDLASIFSGIGRMLQYLNYDFGFGVSTAHIRFFEKPQMYLELYNRVFVILFLAVFFAGVILHKFTKKYERLWFSLFALLFACLSVHLILYPVERYSSAVGESSCHPLLLSLLAVAAYTFTRQKDRRMFAFLALSFAVSFVSDCSSNNSFGSLLLPGNVAAVIIICKYFREQWQGREVRRNIFARKVFICLLCSLIAFIPSFELWHYIYMGGLHETEELFCHLSEPLDTEITSGTLKGIVTTKTLCENYNKCMADIAVIREKYSGSLFVADYDPSVYLNAGFYVAAPSTHMVNRFDLEENWWEDHPERIPDVVYIPFFSLSYLVALDNVKPEDSLAFFEEFADTEVFEGEMGYIVKIDR
ncbi:MAG: hypothetical protein J1E34_01595 [Oscillospiraceae bacterium]|nr:hypothetical protein [Oscillospiraceae bacterium]